MASSAPAGDLAPGSKILISGISGWVASTLALQLLSHPSNFVLTGTTRSSKKGEFLAAYFAEKGFAPERFSFTVVEDLDRPGAWEEVVAKSKPDVIAHVASPFAMGKDLDPETLITPAVNGTLSVFRAAAKVPSVKRIVMTGSLSAVWLSGKPDGVELDESDWNIISPAKCADPNDPDRGFHAYYASKTAAERAAWSFVETEKPGFTLSVVLPTQILGPAINYTPSLGSLNSGTRRLATWLTGQVDTVTGTGSPVNDFVDVRDVAAAHLKLLVAGDAVSGRYIAGSGTYALSQVAHILAAAYPDRKLPPPNPEEEAKALASTPISNRKLKSMGCTFRGLEECVLDTAAAIVALEAKGWDK